MYKLAEGGVINLEQGIFIPDDPLNSDWQDYQAWLALGNIPLSADPPPSLSEGDTGRLTARQWFIDHPAAIAFIRLSAAEQESQIDAMTLAQLKTVLKYLTIAVSAQIKRDYL